MSDKLDLKELFSHSDFWISLVLICLGGVAAMMAMAFDPLSRSYPLVLSVLVMVMGAVLALKTLVNCAPSVHFGLPAKVAMLCALVMVLWIAALSAGLGFILPTLIMQIAFLWICGLRPLGKAMLFSAMITVAGYVVFVLVLNVRLPDSIAPWLL